MENPPAKPTDKSTFEALDYESARVRRHPGAIAAFVLGILGVVTGCLGVGIFPGIAAVILGIWAGSVVERRADVYSGKGYAHSAIVLGCIACILPFVVLALLPSVDSPRELPARAYCAANLRGIAQSMNVYAADNGNWFPVVPYAPYGTANSSASTASFAGTPADAAKSLYAAASPQNGSPLSGAWLLVLNNYTAPQQYVCRSDPYVTNVASLEKSPGVVYLNFQSPNQLSYSFAYPYAPDGKVGAWWKSTMDSTLPVACDMAPKNGTGKPVRNVAPGAAPADPKTWNSANHGGEGENVAFADGHAEFVRRPDIGQGGDNIFTASGIKGVSEFGGTQPGKSPIAIQTDKAPFDVVMVPARDLNLWGF
jgi:prepilin-type processing-associated H-X9-DG protein